jgi:hypothetical protein
LESYLQKKLQAGRRLIPLKLALLSPASKTTGTPYQTRFDDQSEVLEELIEEALTVA